MTDPWHADDYDRALKTHVQVIANFMPFGSRDLPTNRLTEAQRRGLTPMISWLPREPSNKANPHAYQPAFSNAVIAAGGWDRYIRRFARACARFDGTVLLRYAPEFEGSWEPWHRNPAAYVRAWKRIHRIFREEDATNVKFVWSPALPWRGYAGGFEAWSALIQRYWPGTALVDYVGATMVSHNDKGVAFFAHRLPLLWRYGKPVVLAEVHAPERLRATWLPDLAAMVNGMPSIKVVVWCDLTPKTPITASPARLAFGSIEHG
jgi:beta-mannanase